MMPHILHSQKLRILASGAREDAPGMITGWFTIDVSGKKETGSQADITLYSDPHINISDAMEDFAQGVIDYICNTWKFRVNDVNFKALNKLQRSYNEAKFFEEAFQDKAVAVTKAFSVAKKSQKEVNNQIKNICIAFSDILPFDLTVTPTGAKKKKNIFNLVFTENTSKPTRIDELALALLKITEANHEWSNNE